MTKLRQTVEERPDDLQGHQLLVRNEASLQNAVVSFEGQAEMVGNVIAWNRSGSSG